MLDPTIAAAVITASGGMIQKLIEIAGKSEPNAQAKKAASKTYDKLALQITTHSVRVLRALRQVGSYQSPSQVLGIVDPMAKRQEPDGKDFEGDLTYRLKFLCVLGLVQTASATDYAITHFGVAFLAKASEDNIRYSKAFVA